MKHSLLQTPNKKCLLDTLSDVRIKAFTLLFKLRLCLFQTQAYWLVLLLSVVNNF